MEEGVEGVGEDGRPGGRMGAIILKDTDYNARDVGAYLLFKESSNSTQFALAFSSYKAGAELLVEVLAIVLAPGIKSEFEFYLAMEIPGRSSGKISGNSLTTGMSSSLFSSAFFSIT
ncbi:hypothetical protein Tco_1088257 [Tanacetum coccineum]